MQPNYSFFRDELALDEIRKHKWIESEKLGQEIGFASAALDWIKKHGSAWKQFRFQLRSKNCFSEKRRYRRFNQNFPIQLSVNNKQITCQSEDFNLLGLSCRIPVQLQQQTDTDVKICFKKDGRPLPLSRFNFKATMTPLAKKGSGSKVFVSFPEEIKDYIRANADIFCN